MRIFELGQGRKFRATTGTNGFLRLEIRMPDRWDVVSSPDLVSQATNALALAAAGEPPQDFRFTQDDRYIGPVDIRMINPFEQRLRARGL